MIRALVDFALKSRWLILGGVVVLVGWGVVSFLNLPIEAYPDVANNYVQIITQWPGRGAEERLSVRGYGAGRDPDGRNSASHSPSIDNTGRFIEPDVDLRR